MSEKRWRQKLASAGEDDLRGEILDCYIFGMDPGRGPLRDDPEIAAFLTRVRQRDYAALARELVEPLALESFLVHAEKRLGGTGRPVAADYGYLQDILQELARRYARPRT